MKMRMFYNRWEAALVTAALGLGVTLISGLVGIRLYAHNQQMTTERAAPAIQQWQVADLPAHIGRTGRVDVVDTPGVCLYIARFSTDVAMVAVPKSQLKSGIGCQ